MSVLEYGFASQHQVLLTPQVTLDAEIAGIEAEKGKKKDATVSFDLLYTEKTPLAAILEAQRLCFQAPDKEDDVALPTITCQLLSQEQFQQQLQHRYAAQGDGALGDVQTDDWENLSSVMADIGEAEDLLAANSDAPVIRLLNAILSEAIQSGASDVHLEPFESALRVRNRVDGVLGTLHQLDVRLAPLLISRIKVMARLDIAEKRLPQDGRVSIKLAGHQIDLRVSTLPSSFGERAVMRILDKRAGQLSLSDMDMDTRSYQTLLALLNRPNGILLVTGPTGSGKTTTLYAGLSHINQDERNIMTVEDPVEYNLDGINQTQVHTKADMTFAKGLRAILRQDPDVVMVGEIRDGETANIAVQASLTGHLVLSTLHTNTAVGAIGRLRDLGVEPYLLASSLMGVMAQRLVRRLCDHCKRPVPLNDHLRQTLALTDESNPIYEPCGCEACNHTGYKGRMGVYELVLIDDEVKHLIHEQASEQRIEAAVRTHSNSLKDAAYALVRQGDTSLHEVIRVIEQS